MVDIIVTGDFYEDRHFSALKQTGRNIRHVAAISDRELDSIIPSVEAYVLGGDERLTANTLARAHRLRVISFAGVGWEAFVDPQAASKQGIQVLNTPGANTTAVAEHAVGTLLGLMRGLHSHNDAVKRQGAFPGSTEELSGSKIGIIGMGAVGSKITEILVKGFGVEVLYANRSTKSEIESLYGARRCSAQELFANCRAVIVCIAKAPNTISMVDATLFSQSNVGVYLVSVSDASIVNPADLRTALQCRRVLSAGFDGYWQEPLPPPDCDSHGLLALPDATFVVSPHVAAKTSRSWSRTVDAAIENLVHFYLGERRDNAN